MNIKTTIGLSLAVIVVSLGYLLWTQDRAAPQAVADTNTQAPGMQGPATAKQTPAQRLLAQPPLSDDSKIVEVAYQPRDKERMVFKLQQDEAEDVPQDDWEMVEPFRCPATAWMINNVIRAVKRLSYVEKVNPKTEGSTSLEDAGIRPQPRARFALVSDGGERVKIEVGDELFGQKKTYIYVPGREDELYIADEDFSGVLDREITQFRERNLYRMTPTDAVELRVVERTGDDSMTYALLKEQGQWRFAEPFKAKAQSKKIQDVINVLNRLWVREWIEKVPEDLALFGLAAPRLTMTVVTEKRVKKQTDEQVEPEEHIQESETAEQGDSAADQEEEQEPQEETVRNECTFLISDQKPIDDDSQVYAKRGSGKQVGLINVADFEKLVPNMKDWRDMDVIPSKVLEADTLTIAKPDESIEFELRQNTWYFADTDDPAEPLMINDILARLDSLTAVNYVDDPEMLETGLDTPVAEVRLTFKHSDEIETLEIGGFTEPVSRRLRYVQRAGSTAVAKVQSSDLESLLQDARAYRNREILDYAPSRLDEMELVRILEDSGVRQQFTLARDDNQVWKMTAPIEKEVDLKRVNELVDELASLRGLTIVDDTEAVAEGFEQPDVRVRLTIEGIPVAKVMAPDEQSSGEQQSGEETSEEEPAAPPDGGVQPDDEAAEEDLQPDAEGEAAGADEDTTAEDIERPAVEIIEPEPLHREVLFSKQGTSVYARHDKSERVYEVESKLFDDLMAELAGGSLWEFEPSELTRVMHKTEDQEVGFTRDADGWHFTVDPDIPIMQDKVDEYVKKMSEFAIQRYVAYDAASLSEFGLDQPVHTLTLDLMDGSTIKLLVSATRYPTKIGQTRYYAVLEGTNQVFLLPAGTLNALKIKLDRFE